MRQLVVVCEQQHAATIRQAIERYCHPQAISDLIQVVSVGLGGEVGDQKIKHEVLDQLKIKPTRCIVTEPPLLCATREPGTRLGLKHLAHFMGYDYEASSAKALTSKSRSGKTAFERLLNQCGLSVRGFCAGMLAHWAHGAIDRHRLDEWVSQFGSLDKFTWVAEEILRNLRMISAAELGGRLVTLRNENALAQVCVNRDSRTHGKSGEFIANLLTKRAVGNIHDSPAAVIENGNDKVIIFEDGLWSGTEAIGVLESLLGLRDTLRCKTAPLKDPSALQHVDLILAYGIATDYGTSVVRRFLAEKGLHRATVVSAEMISIADQTFLGHLEDGRINTSDVWRDGPPTSAVTPLLLTHLQGSPTSATELEQALVFCKCVGQQLFDNYLASMARIHGWHPWPDSKRMKCALGKDGLGLLHAFEHSVPKASLPLLWGYGSVEWQGKTIDWQPLFMHAAES